MKKLLGKKLNKNGFTLVELLIVVAIIAVLVAIALPVFFGSLDKAKEARDDANKRAIKAVAVESILNDPKFQKPQEYDPKTGEYKATDSDTAARYWMITAFVAGNGDILVHDIIPFVMESEDKYGNPKDYNPNDMMTPGYEWVEADDFINKDGVLGGNLSAFPCIMNDGISTLAGSQNWVREHEGAWCYFFSLTAAGEDFDEFKFEDYYPTP